MIKIEFETLIPNVVRDWIVEKGYEDQLNEARLRLSMKLNNIKEFKSNGIVQDVKYDEHKQMVGVCNIHVEVNNEKEAREEFSKIFRETAKRGQKFRFASFSKIS